MNRDDVKVMFVPGDIIDGYKIDRLNKFKYINVTDAKIIYDLNEKMAKASNDALIGIDPGLIIDYRTIRELCLTDKSIDLKQDNFVLPQTMQNYADDIIKSDYPIFYYQALVLDNILIIVIYDTEQTKLTPEQTIDVSDSDLSILKIKLVKDALKLLLNGIDNKLDMNVSAIRDMFVYYAEIDNKYQY